MAIIARDNPGTQFEPAPEGLHRAVCVDVIYLGVQDTPYGRKPQVRFVWQIEDINEVNGERFQVRQTYTLSMNEMSKLSQHLESWRSQAFTDAEREGFDVEKLIGVNCQLQLIHRTSAKGRTYATIQAIVPQQKGVEPLQPLDYERSPNEQGVSFEESPNTSSFPEGESHADNGEDMPF